MTSNTTSPTEGRFTIGVGQLTLELKIPHTHTPKLTLYTRGLLVRDSERDEVRDLLDRADFLDRSE